MPLENIRLSRKMLNKLFIIKFIHTIIFYFMSACLLYVLYCGITRTYNWLLIIAISAILIEGSVLILNHWRCPLTTLATKHGAEKGSVTDTFLPKWLARNVFNIFAVVFVASLILLGLGYFTN